MGRLPSSEKSCTQNKPPSLPATPHPRTCSSLDVICNADGFHFASGMSFTKFARRLISAFISGVISPNDATIEGWSRALDLRDKETEGHTLRVTAQTLELAHIMGLSGDQLVNIRRSALLHDIGKMGVPDHILLKAEDLTEDEWKIMRKHPTFAFELLSPIRYLKSAAIDIPYCHHEKWDGTGYPRGLKGEQIPLAARIFAAPDVWDALTSDRPYRPAWSLDLLINL